VVIVFLRLEEDGWNGDDDDDDDDDDVVDS
jgi:hypothetical protein